jgi:hypothetical protein
MNLSNFYARLLGFYLVIISIGMFFRGDAIRDLISQTSHNTVMTSLGLFGLILGLAIVVSHQVWKGWPIIITIVGYWIAIKGIIIIFYPEWIFKIVQVAWNGSNLQIALGFDLILGLILLFCGYKLAKP